ncbi:MAG: class I SAM-dependent methyltransferase, partial [Deltaproteobacteria bacterium]
ICRGHGRLSFQSRDLLYDKPQTYEYMQCCGCGLIYQHPMPDPVQINSFYLDDYAAYKPLGRLKRCGQARRAVLRHRYGYSHLDMPLLFRLLAPMLSVFRYRDAIPFVPSGRAIDIGCGNGKFMRTMNALGWHFEGVEFNSTAVDICRREGLKVFHGDLHEVAFEDNAFDLVSARHVIEHMPDPGDFVAEIVRILKKGGRLVIRTPNSQALGRQWFGKYWYANEVPRHLVLFNPGSLRMLTERHGLRLITEKLFTSPKIILNSWDYLTGNRGRPSRKRKFLRLLARPYMMLATVSGRGDEIFAIYERS